MTPSIKMLLVQPTIPSYRRRVFEELCSSRNPEVTIIAGIDGSHSLKQVAEEDLTRLRYRFAAVHNLHLGRAITVLWQPEAWRLVRSEKPDLVVVHGGIYDLTSWLILLWGRVVGVPVMSWTIGLQVAERPPKIWLRRIFYGLARGLLLYGDYPRHLLAQAGLSVERMFVVYNSLDFQSQRDAERKLVHEELASFKARHNITEISRCLIFIGRIVPRKRLHIAIEAVSELVKKGRDIHLFVLGDGSDLANLKEISAAKMMDANVHFAGSIYDESVIAQYMHISHASIVPEAGLPIIHPMGYGVPPIISDNIERHGTEWEAVEEGVTGYFYKDNDARDLEEAIIRCLDDEVTRLRISESCRRRAEERYTPEGHAQRILSGAIKFAGIMAT